MEITFLGTSSMVPTKERNPSAVFLAFEGEGILFDCAEGTQRQMNIAGIRRSRVGRILISHWHGDHVSGLIGLLQTMGNKEKNPIVELYGPVGTKKYVGHLLKSVVFDQQVDLKVFELKPKKVETFFENERFTLQCVALQHRIPCIGFSLLEKDMLKVDMLKLKKMGVVAGPHLKKLKDGKDIVYGGKKIAVNDVTLVKKGRKVVYVMDTMYCENAVILAREADLLICEATHANELQDKATEFMHMTAKDAATIAQKANVKKLVITHFSQRYKDVSVVLKDAKKVFKKTVTAEDFMKVVV